nr:MAG TPA: hypothetical protein [Crassvirales sp.]
MSIFSSIGDTSSLFRTTTQLLLWYSFNPPRGDTDLHSVLLGAKVSKINETTKCLVKFNL